MNQPAEHFIFYFPVELILEFFDEVEHGLRQLHQLFITQQLLLQLEEGLGDLSRLMGLKLDVLALVNLH
jgi:hypothetical protein